MPKGKISPTGPYIFNFFAIPTPPPIFSAGPLPNIISDTHQDLKWNSPMRPLAGVPMDIPWMRPPSPTAYIFRTPSPPISFLGGPPPHILLLSQTPRHTFSFWLPPPLRISNGIAILIQYASQAIRVKGPSATLNTRRVQKCPLDLS